MVASSRPFFFFLFFALALGSGAVVSSHASAGEPPPAMRTIRFRFHPVERAQIAVWVERSGAPFFHTVRLTQAVARRGIGNRPGALQMNSGYRWPYGRRESALPVWAHRRVEVGAQEPFRRVIFRDRTTEGAASQSFAGSFPTEGYRDNPDDYFCLSFRRELSARDALDAVACATVFSSDKGRYVRDVDVAANYAEPFVDVTGDARMRPLGATSLYPPRRDLSCARTDGCANHPDVAQYVADAMRVMPEIDAATMATLSSTEYSFPFQVPLEWPDGEYVAYLEVNLEGDYNERFNELTFPTPVTPTGLWDTWATSYGYAYRGQPSVVYRVPFTLGADETRTTAEPAGYGEVNGSDGEMRPMTDGGITNDPLTAPGSGADRVFRAGDGWRFRVDVTSPAFCVGNLPPDAAGDFAVTAVTDEKHSHEWADLSFTVPFEDKSIDRYEVRVSASPITDEASFLSGQPANAATLEDVALELPTTGEVGDVVSVRLGGLTPQARFYVGLRAVDVCGQEGPITTTEVHTSAIHFSVVSPCFVATAAYGTPMATEVAALRRFRDRHLQTNAAGRALVAAYYAVGPTLARIIRDDEALRRLARLALRPAVHAARAIDGEP